MVCSTSSMHVGMMLQAAHPRAAKSPARHWPLPDALNKSCTVHPHPSQARPGQGQAGPPMEPGNRTPKQGWSKGKRLWAQGQELQSDQQAERGCVCTPVSGVAAESSRCPDVSRTQRSRPRCRTQGQRHGRLREKAILQSPGEEAGIAGPGAQPQGSLADSRCNRSASPA